MNDIAIGFNKNGIKRKLPHHNLWWQIVLGLVAGVVVGLLISPKGAALIPEVHAQMAARWLALPGHIFLALIQMVVVPLVMTSIILGIAASGNTDFLKRVGLRIAPYFVGTTAIAITIGIVMTMWLQPGTYIDQSLLTGIGGMSQLGASTSPLPEMTMPERIVAIIPSNPDKAIEEKAMFQIVVYAILMAVALVSIDKERAQPVISILYTVQDVMMKVVSWAMALAPLAVFGLLAQISIDIGIDAILGMSMYVGTVLSGLILLLLVYLLIVAVLAKRNPLAFAKAIKEVQLLAFSTSSSAAVLPLSLKTAEKKLEVPVTVSRFIVPLGATVNMDGTALYQVSAAIFLTQVFGIDLTLSEVILLALTTVGASIGTPSTPGVGIVILATILQSIGVPAHGIAMIIGVDRILDMCRTSVNVSGDLAACMVMERWLGASEEISDLQRA